MTLILLFALAAASPAPADRPVSAEPFSVAKDPCARWTVQQRLQGVVRQRFTSWLEGVLTGYAIAAHKQPPTAESTVKVRGWLDDFCQAHPEVTMGDAVATLLRPRSAR